MSQAVVTGFRVERQYVGANHAAGAAPVQWLDTAGHEIVLFVGQLGSMTLSGVAPVVEYSTNGTTKTGDITGTAIDPMGGLHGNDANNKQFSILLRVAHSPGRWVRCHWNMTTTGVFFGALVALLFRGQYVDDGLVTSQTGEVHPTIQIT